MGVGRPTRVDGHKMEVYNDRNSSRHEWVWYAWETAPYRSNVFRLRPQHWDARAGMSQCSSSVSTLENLISLKKDESSNHGNSSIFLYIIPKTIAKFILGYIEFIKIMKIAWNGEHCSAVGVGGVESGVRSFSPRRRNLAFLWRCVGCGRKDDIGPLYATEGLNSEQRSSGWNMAEVIMMFVCEVTRPVHNRNTS